MVELSEGILQTWESLQNLTKVRDLVTSKTKTLLIFESPHTNELSSRIPLTGPSGKAMTRVLFQGMVRHSMGMYIHNQINKDLKYPVGLLNVSQLPLQSKAYSFHERRDHAGLIYMMDHMRREYLRSHYTNPMYQEVEKVMFNSFIKRVMNLESLETIIACGKFAQYYTSILIPSLPNVKTYIDDIPHPSQGLWDRDPNFIRDRILKYFFF